MDKIAFLSFKNTFLLVLFALLSCGKVVSSQKTEVSTPKPLPIILGAEQTKNYLPLLENKRIALVGNPTSVLFNSLKKPIHVVDSLLSLGVKLTKVFAPEHGFRGNADAGEVIKNGKDIATGLQITSLYGKNKKPSPEMLVDIDLVIFDIQDVGARFYTYISTLHYVMEACAEANIPVIIFDRPNPNGHYVDGPILEPEYKSFVGLHPIPIVHGMTIGEYAQMINGEKWLTNGLSCELNVIKMKNYAHSLPYSLPIKPSPNLPNDKSINLYPSLCLFEGTPISVGRGTHQQFQIYGAPNLPETKFNFTPVPLPGAKSPKFNGKLCFGKNLQQTDQLNEINLDWLLKSYAIHPNKNTFFSAFFTKLAGTKKLQEQIEKGWTAIEIKASWEADLTAFKIIRNKYLLYPDTVK